MGNPKPRAAKEIIDDALQSNRWWEWLAFTLVIVLVVTGVSTLVVGIILDRWYLTLSGGGVTCLFWPAMRVSLLIRSENIRIRLYEIAISKATTASETADILTEALGPGKSNISEERKVET
jgi:hypothetical protein